VAHYANPDDAILTLSLDWSPSTSTSAGPQLQLITSQSDGALQLLQHVPGSTSLTPLHAWPAHTFEAWNATFDRWSPHLVYSGGDDGLFRGWDVRSRTPTHTSKAHDAGVCSIVGHPVQEGVLLTGSYDEAVRTWDARMLRRPLASCPVGGGVWRLKWSPHDPALLLAACMYNGFHVLRQGREGGWLPPCALGDGEVDLARLHSLTHVRAHPHMLQPDPGTPEGFAPVHHYEEHASIAYGADWFHEPRLRGLVGTCSFYDHLFHLWRAPDP
jgi:diphthamide biosynthesis protein 7